METTQHSLTECCMCGDVGFPDKLFQCVRCIYRFQHYYCGNYYEETSTVCDWCRSEERTGTRHGKAAATAWSLGTSMAGAIRSEHPAGEKIKQGGSGNVGYDCGGSGAKGKTSTGSGSSSSGKHGGRRYKLLKDVMC